MNISARNVPKGSVKSMEHGAVNSEVIVEVSAGVEVVAMITKDSAERLHLSQGNPVYAVSKASDVMIATE